MKYIDYLPNSEEYHVIHYLILFMGLAVFLLCFYFFRYLPTYQVAVALLGCTYYVVWGFLHHLLEGRLKKVVMLEYILFGLLGFLILLVLILL